MSDPTTNEQVYLDLMMAIEDLQGQMNLLVAVCDDSQLRDRLIDRYETELRKQGITAVRSRLNPGVPSVTDAIRGAIAASEAEPGVITIVGADELSFMAKAGETSPQEQFLGYLQWTRESLLVFRLPLVLWVDSDLANKLVFRASDFWSWRKAVFRFERESEPEMNPWLLPKADRNSTWDRPEDRDLSLQNLQGLIAETEQRDPKSPYLATLYDRLGEVYRTRLEHGELVNAPTEIREAFRSFDHAIDLQAELGLTADLVNSYQHRGILHDRLSDYPKAIRDHERSHQFARDCGDRQGEAASLGNLGNAYQSLGQYERAIDLHQQSLAIQRELGNRQGEAASLRNLGNAYKSLGQYERAIDLHQQSLAIERELGNRRGEATSLGNLGNAYYSLGQYERAIDLHQQSLAIQRELGDRQGEAASLVNLGNAYYSLGQYERAIDFYRQSLAITEQIGTRLEIAIGLFNLGYALAKTDDRWSARDAFTRARALYADMGLEHQVKNCNNALEQLARVAVATVRRAPRIGDDAPKQPTSPANSLITLLHLPAKLWRGFVRLIRWWLTGCP
jgi:tetratricopeptide (TPR) repeat protein